MERARSAATGQHEGTSARGSHGVVDRLDRSLRRTQAQLVQVGIYAHIWFHMSPNTTNRPSVDTPLQHHLDFVRTMMLKRRFEVLIGMPVCNEVHDTLRPARLRQDEIVHGELEMIA